MLRLFPEVRRQPAAPVRFAQAGDDVTQGAVVESGKGVGEGTGHSSSTHAQGACPLAEVTSRITRGRGRGRVPTRIRRNLRGGGKAAYGGTIRWKRPRGKYLWSVRSAFRPARHGRSRSRRLVSCAAANAYRSPKAERSRDVVGDAIRDAWWQKGKKSEAVDKVSRDKQPRMPSGLRRERRRARRNAIASGLLLVPEDRQRDGLVVLFIFR